MASLSSILGKSFNAREVEPQAPRDDQPLPAGLYSVEITNAEVKPLKSGNGTGLTVEFTVIDPAPHARRKVWSQLNIQHSSAQAEQIGQSQLSALCAAVGIEVLEDSDQLFQKILRIRTKVRPADGQYAARAEVSSFEPAGSGPLPTQSHAPAQQPAAGAPKATPPWQKRAA
ncbi:MAG: DUF669 domain-containing protein [Limnohabitans sp.]